MKTICCMLVGCLLWLTLPGAGQAAELTQGDKDTIFIGELKIQPSVIEAARKQGRLLELQRAYETLESQFATSLSATRIFQLIERKQLDTLTTEQKFAESGMTDIDSKSAAKSGKLLGAKFVFLPVIDGFEDISNAQEYQAIGRSEMTRTIFISAIVKIVDTTTGALLPDVPSVQLKKNEIVQNVQFGQAVGSEELIVALAKETSQKLCQDVIGLLRPAKVLSVTGKQIMINRGSEAGFKVGDTVEVYATEEVKDEDSGEVFRNEIPMGQAKITRIDKKQSFAMINGDDLGIAKGCVVRLFQSESTATNSDVYSEEPGTTPGSSEKPLKWQ